MRHALFVSTIAVLLGVSPAAASVGIFCSGPDGVAFDAALSGGAGLSTMSATVEAAGRTWLSETTRDDPNAIAEVQSFADGETMRFDFADTNYEANVVEVRLFIAGEGAIGGTLSIVGVGSWVISCDIG